MNEYMTKSIVPIILFLISQFVPFVSKYTILSNMIENLSTFFSR